MIFARRDGFCVIMFYMKGKIDPMKKKNLIAILLLIVLAVTLSLAIRLNDNEPAVPDPSQQETDVNIKEDGSYFDKDNVALYIHTYGHLPDNYVTKEKAREAGWEGGSVQKYLPGKAIGGDKYSNYEKTLPTQKGRQYFECDIDTDGKSSRGAKRIVFSNDGLIYYTEDHYEHFTLLYGEE